MACRGVHFALSEAEAGNLRSLPGDEERLEYVQKELEERYFEELRDFLGESDKAWDAMHRALADGHLTWDGGEYPLNHVVLAGELLYEGDDYILSLKSPAQVRDIAAALAPIDEAEFRRRYDLIDAESYQGELADDDFEYTWANFQDVREFYGRAAEGGRVVLFTVDQ